jgi:hypothetical protein
MADGVVVGRIMCAAASPVGTPGIDSGLRIPRGSNTDARPETTREAAMVAFAESWSRERCRLLPWHYTLPPWAICPNVPARHHEGLAAARFADDAGHMHELGVRGDSTSHTEAPAKRLFFLMMAWMPQLPSTTWVTPKYRQRSRSAKSPRPPSAPWFSSETRASCERRP